MGSFCAHLLDIWVPVRCMPHLALGSRRGKAPSRYEACVMFVLAPTLQWATPKPGALFRRIAHERVGPRPQSARESLLW